MTPCHRHKNNVVGEGVKVTRVERIVKSRGLCVKRNDYRGFSLNPARFTLNIARLRPAAQVRMNDDGVYALDQRCRRPCSRSL